MAFALIALLCGVGLFVLMVVSAEIGRRLGIARVATNADGLAKGAGASEAAVFGLLGLLIAFTFAGAANRFEARRQLIVEEANAIGTAYLRLDLLPADAQPELRELFRRYIDVRLATFGGSDVIGTARTKLAEAGALQADLWTKTLTAARRPDASAQATVLVVPALNALIDVTASRQVATANHAPLVVFLLLAGLSLVGSVLIGYDTSANKNRSWLHVLTFAGILSLTVYVIIDLEFPRLGLIRVEAADQALVDFRKSIQ